MKYLYFKSDYCYACKKLSPIIKKVSEHINVDIIDIENMIDVDTMLKKYNIRSIPTVILVNDIDEKLETYTGVKTEEFYISTYQSYLD